MYQWVTIQHLVQWTKGELYLGDPKQPVKSISSDTRTFKRGEVFLALKGENFDGHDYLKKAAEIGAALLISEKKVEFNCPVLVVPNALNAYVQIAQGLREKFTGPVVAVTGSAGKSSTRDMVAVLLGENTLKAPSSYNNLLGVSKTLCLLEDHHEKLVLEVGMNHLGEIKEICQTFKPTAGLITNVGDAHIGFLGSVENIFKAKKELFDFLGSAKNAKGVAVNVDDPFVVRARKEAIPPTMKVVTYSAEGMGAEVRILLKSIDPQTCYLNLKLEIQKEVFTASCKIFGLHHAQNAVAAIAMVTLLGVSKKQIGERLANLSPAPHRGQISQLDKGVTVIDESYNSNPSALKSSLDSLSHLNAQRRRIIVIGEMRELGEFSEKLHVDAAHHVVSAIKKSNAVVVSVGKAALPFHEELKNHTLNCELHHVENHTAALELVRAKLLPKDIVFVKGSHGVRLDILVDALLSS